MYRLELERSHLTSTPCHSLAGDRGTSDNTTSSNGNGTTGTSEETGSPRYADGGECRAETGTDDGGEETCRQTND